MTNQKIFKTKVSMVDCDYEFEKDSGNGGDGNTTSSSAEFIIFNTSLIVSGAMRLVNVGGNSWVCDFTFGTNISWTVFGGGRISLSGTLDRVQLSPSSGNFDSTGSVSVISM